MDDEHRTSKCCSSCGDELKYAILCKQPRETRQRTSRRWIVRAARKEQLAERFRAKTGLYTPPRPHVQQPASARESPAGKRQPPRLDADARVARTRFVRRASAVAEQPELVSSYCTSNAAAILVPKYCTPCNRLWCRDKNACRRMRSRMCWLLAQDTPVSRLTGRLIAPPTSRTGLDPVAHSSPGPITSPERDQGAVSRLLKPYGKRSCMNVCFE